MAKIIGYGICGPGEAGRYMRETLEEFKRLCDDVVILCNNCDQAEMSLLDEYGFRYVQDRREWGSHQWRIKQDFIEREIKQIANDDDMLVCLDMDETIPKLTKEWLKDAPLDAYHVFVVDLWNDDKHFKLDSCFWNVRIWRWNGETKFKAKPVHCGLAPEWAYHYHRHAPFLLLHKGLMDKESRKRKLERYAKYDPHAVHLDKKYYDMLKSDTAEPFDFPALSKQIEDEVATYKETKPKKSMPKKRERFAYFKNPHGNVVDVPERHIEKTKKQKGMEFIGWADEENEDIESMFEDTDVDETATPTYRAHPHENGSYQRPQADEAAEINDLNNNGTAGASDVEDDEDVEDMFDEDEPADHTGDVDEKVVDKPVENPMPDPNKKPETKVETPKVAAKAPAKKAAKKAAKKTTKKK